jgi:hypothetical protein
LRRERRPKEVRRGGGGKTWGRGPIFFQPPGPPEIFKASFFLCMVKMRIAGTAADLLK